MSGLELYRVGSASNGESGSGGEQLFPVMHLKAGEVARTYSYKDGRQIYRYIFQIPKIVDDVGALKIYRITVLPSDADVWIDPAYSWVRVGGFVEPINLQKDSTNHAAFWLALTATPPCLLAITPTDKYINASAQICIAFIDLNEEPQDIEAINTDGALVIRGESAFETWMRQNNIEDTPETRDANWLLFMNAIRGSNGAGDFIGEIVIAGGAVPEGTLECDGSIVTYEDFPELGEYLKTAQPLLDAGDGVHFSLPDMRGMFLRGIDATRGILTSQQDAVQDISATGIFHSAITNDITMSGAVKISSGGGTAIRIGNITTGTRAAFDFHASNDPNVRTANETRPVNRAVRFCIRYTLLSKPHDVFMDLPENDGVVYSLHNSTWCEQCIIYDGD